MRGFSLPRHAFAIVVPLSPAATTLAFGNASPKQGDALGTLAEDTVMLITMVPVITYARSMTRRKAQQA
ncbi:hypothetical protein [Streptomyces sp. NBC_01518]|uniref:hypothetical protein n=1 Tax=Streptomyces sp. NBC_01518 TaxID=2903891 RepID=UPI003865D9BE